MNQEALLLAVGVGITAGYFAYKIFTAKSATQRKTYENDFTVFANIAEKL